MHPKLTRQFSALGLALVFVISGCTRAKNASPVTVQNGTLPPVLTPAAQIVQETASPTQLFIVPLPTPSPAPTVTVYSGPLHGIEMHAISPEGGLERLRESGATWVRRNGLLWSLVEPEEGARNWDALAPLEEELKSAAEIGMKTILIVRDAPPWAQQIPGVSCGPVSQEKLAAFASFMRDAVARYSQPPFSVKYWELGNEPDIASTDVPPDSHFGCWGDAGDPYFGGGYYAEMLKAVYPVIKAADPESQVMTGGLLLDCDPINPPLTPSGEPKNCTPARFLEGILKNGGGDAFDIVSFHVYDYSGAAIGTYGNGNWGSLYNTTGPALIAKTRFVRSVLASNGYTNKGLMNTESAVLCTVEDAICQSDIFEQTKANYVAQAYASSLAEGLQANIWYSSTGWRYSGLFDYASQPFAAFDAFRFSAGELRNAVFSREITEFPGVKGYVFQQEGKQIWVVWSLDGGDHIIALTQDPLAVLDRSGAPQGIARSLTVGLAPLYIELAQQ